MVNTNKAKQIHFYLSLENNELFAILPQYHPEYSDHFLGSAEKTKIGEKIYNELKSSLYRKICGEWDYCKKQSDKKYQDKVTLIAGIADIIVSLCGSIPPITVATIAFKLGLSNLCGCRE